MRPRETAVSAVSAPEKKPDTSSRSTMPPISIVKMPVMNCASQYIHHFERDERRGHERLAQKLSARKPFGWNAREYIEALGLTHRCFGQKLTAQTGECHALAGITVGEEDALTQPAEMGHARAGDADRSAPGI